jgi:hypothetical protein
MVVGWRAPNPIRSNPNEVHGVPAPGIGCQRALCALTGGMGLAARQGASPDFYIARGTTDDSS